MPIAIDTSERTPSIGAERSQEKPRLPPEILAVLEELKLVLADAGAVSAMITGSTARGEIAYYRVREDLVLRSDIELYAIGRDPVALASKVAAAVDRMERRYRARWPGFHIDIAYLSPKQFRRLPAWIRHFEMKANAWALLGPEFIDKLPEVSAENLDWQELNEVVLWQLLGLVARTPAAWLAGDRDLTADEKHALTSVLLNITTWALPGEGVLLPTYHDRVEYWSRSASARWFQDFGIELELLPACLRSRREPSCPIAAGALFGTAVRAWNLAFAVVTGESVLAHPGCGEGFLRGNLPRRVRAAYRVRGHGVRSFLRTFRQGSSACAAADARKLAVEALELRESHSKRGITEWNARRRRVMCYVDRALNRPEWVRHLPTESR